MTYTEIIADAMKISTLPTPPDLLPRGSRCRYTGEEIVKGYRHDGGVISEPTARLLLGQLPNSKGKMVSAMWNRGSIACFSSGAFYWPMQSPVSAEREGRIAWRDAVPTFWKRHWGERCAIVITTDVKKAVWDMYTEGGCGTLGRATPVVIHVPSVMTGRFVVDWWDVIEAQDLVRRCRAAGYSRIEGRLPWPLWVGQLGLDHTATAQLPRSEVMGLQLELDKYKGSKELLIALVAEGYSLNPKEDVTND